MNVYLSMRDRYGGENWLVSRLAPFLVMGFSAFIPIVHATMLFPYDQLQKQIGLNYYYLEGVCMLTGVIFLTVSAIKNTCAPFFPFFLFSFSKFLPSSLLSLSCRTQSTTGDRMLTSFFASPCRQSFPSDGSLEWSTTSGPLIRSFIVSLFLGP